MNIEKYGTIIFQFNMFRLVKNYVEGLRYLIKDIFNYIFIIRSILNHKNDKDWKALNLRHDWIFRIYTVVSLKEEDLDQDETFQYRTIIERTSPANDYLCDSVGLLELITPRVEKIDDSLSYLVVYYPIFYQFSFFYIFYYAFTLTLFSLGIQYLYLNYDNIRIFLIITFFKLRGLF